jgi:hypothetical protein
MNTEKLSQADKSFLLLFMCVKISSLHLKSKRFVMWKFRREHVPPCRYFAASFKCAANERFHAPFSPPEILNRAHKLHFCFLFSILILWQENQLHKIRKYLN